MGDVGRKEEEGEVNEKGGEEELQYIYIVLHTICGNLNNP